MPSKNMTTISVMKQRKTSNTTHKSIMRNLSFYENSFIFKKTLTFLTSLNISSNLDKQLEVRLTVYSSLCQQGISESLLKGIISSISRRVRCYQVTLFGTLKIELILLLNIHKCILEFDTSMAEPRLRSRHLSLLNICVHTVWYRFNTLIFSLIYLEQPSPVQTILKLHSN